MKSTYLEELITNYDIDTQNLIKAGYLSNRPLTIRINTLKTSVDYILEYFDKNNIEYKKVSWSPNALIITNKKEEDLNKLDIYEDGFIYFKVW